MYVVDRVNDTQELMKRKSQIKISFLSLIHDTFGLLPMRIPRLLVDFSNNTVLLTGLILERPSFLCKKK